MNSHIKNIHAREILDSRGNPTIEVDVLIGNDIMGRASVPSGASTGKYEATELRDKDNTRYLGKGVINAVNNVNGELNKTLIGLNVNDQSKIDKTRLNSMERKTNRD